MLQTVKTLLQPRSSSCLPCWVDLVQNYTWPSILANKVKSMDLPVWGEPFNRIQRKWKRIKSQNHLGWKGPLEVVWYNFKAGPGYSCVVEVWVPPRLEIPQPLWAAYASVRPVRENKLGKIQRQTDSSAFQIQLCCQRDQNHCHRFKK